MNHQTDLRVEREFPGDHCLHELVERHRIKHQVDLHVEGESPGDHCLHQLVERHHTEHQAAHNNWEKSLPSSVGIEDSLPFVTTHSGDVLLPEKIEYKYGQI